MTSPITSRRSFLGLAAASTLGAFGLAACGTSGPAPSGGGASGEGGGTTATMWALSGQPPEGIREDAVAAFNKLGKGTITVTTFQNDPYKAKIRTAIGAGEAPTLIYGWGGGILKSYADADQVEDLTSWIEQTSGFKERFLPSTWGAATLGGKIFAVPIQSTQPVLMYYNKSLFEKAGAQPPASWDDVMNLVGVFNDQGVAPFSLGGQSKWTSMMWMEYLLDRTGGPEVFDAIFANKADAWSDPAVIEACTKIQDLVKANGFIKGFSLIAADTNADQALLYTGKAAMMLHGSWAYGGMKDANPDFVANGLQVGNFPSVPGGKGDQPTSSATRRTTSRSLPRPPMRRRTSRRRTSPTDCSPTPRCRPGSTRARCRSQPRHPTSCPALRTRRSWSWCTAWCPRRRTSSSPGTRPSARLRPRRC